MKLLLLGSKGLGIGALAILIGVALVLALIYVVMMLEHRKEMHRKLDKIEKQRLEKEGLVAKNSTFNREEDLEVLVCDLRLIEKKLVKSMNSGSDNPKYRNLARVAVKRIKVTQDLVYDLSRYFNDHKYSVRVKTDEAKKITCQLTREAIRTYQELEELLLGTAPVYEKEISDIAGELDVYVYKEVSRLLEKIDKINQNLRQ